MKKTILPFLALSLFLLTTAFQNTGTSWTDVKNKTMMTTANAAKYGTLDQKDPESVVRYFYASRLRRNSDWRKAVHQQESEWTMKMKTAMNNYARYTFKKVGLQKYRKMFDNEYRYKIYYEALEKGKLKKSSGEVVVQSKDGKWFVLEVPA